MPLGNQKRINYALAATLLMSGIPVEEVVKECGAKNVNVLRVGLCKRGVTVARSKALQSAANATANTTANHCPRGTMSVTARIATEASSIIAESGRKLRQSLATASEHAAAVLDSKPAKNVSEVIQRAATIKSLVDSGDKLHGWSAQASAPTFNLTILERDDPRDCGLNTPTGGMPSKITDAPTPQSEQVVDVDEVA